MMGFWRLYDQATTALLALSGFLMFGIAIVNALLRYFFDAPLVWAEEISRYSMVWGTLIGIALAYRGGHHVAITLLVDLLPKRALGFFLVLCDVLALVVAGLVFQSGFVLTRLLGAILAPSSQIPMVWIYAAIPVGAAMLAVEAARHLCARLAAAFRTAAP
jgi:TRAP-type C4-dicarboxylate transport system permease small subunit